MAIKITPVDVQPGETVAELVSMLENCVRASFADTRFVIGRITSTRRSVSIHNVLLRESKAYCGNHPSGCEVAHDGPHKKHKYLEGADWVEFNDRLNDILDADNVAANVGSSLVEIRRGKERRTRYENGERQRNGNFQWLKYGKRCHYEDRTLLKSKRSWFPRGTPGRYKDEYFEVG
jgi:hypothetical protein